jgi:UDP-2,3-diacylglucosamine pyrophosphatase LpxH
MININYLIISDTHLGIKDSKTKELLKLFEIYKPKHIILNGDIIDGWAINRGSKFKKNHIKIITKLLKLSNNTKITWIRGNHDEFISDFINTNIGNIEISNDLIIDVDDKKYFIFHGDLIDVFITKYKWLAHLGSIGYDIALFLNRHLNHIRNKLGLKYYPLSSKLKDSIKFATNHINNFEETACKIAESKNCQGVICGHIHKPTIKNINNITYINSGDWIENMSAIIIDENNNINLEFFCSLDNIYK